MRCRALPLLLLLLVSPYIPGQTTVANVQAKLLKLQAVQMDTEVPASIQQGISALKQALVDATDKTMGTLPSSSNASTVRAAMATVLPPSTLGHRTDSEWTALGEDMDKPVPALYGAELHFDVKQPQSSLLLIQESFSINCGTDNLLLAYKSDGKRWQRILRWQSKPYAQISGAFGDTYKTSILRPTKSGHPLLLVVHGTPWCTSTMSGFDMDVFELGVSDGSPLWHAEHGYRRADRDPPLTLKATADGFEVRTSVNSWTDRISRGGVMRYAVQADGIHRVEPIAMNAADSLEEWLEMPRADAREFADEPAGTLTWKLFDQLNYEVHPDDLTHSFPDYGALQACKDNTKHFQEQITLKKYAGSKTVIGATYYAQILHVTNGYRIHAVTAVPDGSCSGPDLMAGPTRTKQTANSMRN